MTYNEDRSNSRSIDEFQRKSADKGLRQSPTSKTITIDSKNIQTIDSGNEVYDASTLEFLEMERRVNESMKSNQQNKISQFSNPYLPSKTSGTQQKENVRDIFNKYKAGNLVDNSSNKIHNFRRRILVGKDGEITRGKSNYSTTMQRNKTNYGSSLQRNKSNYGNKVQRDNVSRSKSNYKSNIGGIQKSPTSTSFFNCPLTDYMAMPEPNGEQKYLNAIVLSSCVIENLKKFAFNPNIISNINHNFLSSAIAYGTQYYYNHEEILFSPFFIKAKQFGYPDMTGKKADDITVITSGFVWDETKKSKEMANRELNDIDRDIEA